MSCQHLPEWLTGNLSSLPRVTRSDIQAHEAADVDLKLARDLGNTYKHHTRTVGTEARLGPIDVSNAGYKMTIEYGNPGGTPSTRDALDLAEACVASWRQFLSVRGIQAP